MIQSAQRKRERTLKIQPKYRDTKKIEWIYMACEDQSRNHEDLPCILNHLSIKFMEKKIKFIF